MAEDIKTFRDMLAVNKHDLDRELEIQAVVMDRISQQVGRTGRALVEAKDELARAEARISQNLAENSATKLTVTALDAAVKRSPERRDAFRALQDARSEFEAWEALREAWKQKGYSLKTLADLYASSYFAVSATQSRGHDSGPRRIYGQEEYERSRERAAERRRSGQSENPEPPRERRRLGKTEK